MEGAKRKIHRLRNSLSHRLSSTEVGHQDGNAFLSSNGSPRTLSNAKSVSQDGAQDVGGKLKRVSRDVPKSFTSKKTAILEKLAVPDEDYSDNSPKGSVDEGIKGLIELVNGSEGWVTTSSCAGRVSVFVEGRREERVDGSGSPDNENEHHEENMGEGAVRNGQDVSRDQSEEDDVADEGQSQERKKFKTGPGGKGGGRWLYVSHDPIPNESPSDHTENHFTRLFNLEPMTCSTTFPRPSNGQPPRLIHLEFSPLILHILAATLHHARPLLAAAINASFRESGVQSLKALYDEEAGVMIGIRTAGLVFETVIGVVAEDESGEEKMQAVVSEEYLKMCVEVIRERFEGNEKRKQRLRKELEKVVTEEKEEADGESEEDRRQRNKEEGLKRQEEVQHERSKEKEEDADGDVLEGGLDVPISK